jgi:hypothetical protein
MVTGAAPIPNTQKPVALLERILVASCPEDGVVLDPFCGCGTTIDAAERLGRRWIGVDITHLAIGLIKYRLPDTHGDHVNYEVRGDPTTSEDARVLAKQDRYQFEYWALGQVHARRNDHKGADAAVDGRLYFHDLSGKTRDVVLQVKSGQLKLSEVRDFGRVIEREDADIGVLLTLNQPTAKMRAEAAGLGTRKLDWRTEPYPRYQILTINELLDGAQIEMPPQRQTNVTFTRAQQYRPGSQGEQIALDDT